MRPVDGDMAHLQAVVDNHRIWDCDLLKACARGDLSYDDFRTLFGQYAHYSNHFTRYLAGVLLSCEDDLMRAKLSENLWEEGGGTHINERHAELFRRFLVHTMGISKPRESPLEDFTDVFVRRYLRGASSSDHTYGCAFLALGTEGIVARLYAILVDGMQNVGIPDDALGFFKLHIHCDDDHAATLVEMMCASRGRPDWLTVCQRGIQDALSARADFFDALYANRRPGLHAPVHSEPRSPQSRSTGTRWHYTREERGELLSSPSSATPETALLRHRMRFYVGQALDVLTIDLPPTTRTHSQPCGHDTVIHVLEGHGSTTVGDQTFPVSAGDTVFVPRWELHQTQNTGTLTLRVLVVTDMPRCDSGLPAR